MSFKSYAKPSLYFDIDNEKIKSKANTSANILRRMTIDLSYLYKLVETRTPIVDDHNKKKNIDKYTDSNGFLKLSSHPPLLCKRYRYESQLSCGRFAQIVSGIDTYVKQLNNNDNSNQQVAIKILREQGVKLGLREAAVLSLLNWRTKIGAKVFVELKDVCSFQNHLCLVLPLYEGTLLDYIDVRFERSENQSSSSSSSLKFEGRSKALVQPKVLRLGQTHTLGFGLDHIDQEKYHRHNTINHYVSGNNGDTTKEFFSDVRVLRSTDIRHIALKLLSALLILTQEGLIHADIKPENVFIIHRSDGSIDVRLGDFGNSLLNSEAKACFTDFEVQSLPYRAPEVALGIAFDGQIDVWSLGVLLVELCLGRSLFLVKDREELVEAICTRLPPIPKERFTGGMFYHLLQRDLPSAPEPLTYLSRNVNDQGTSSTDEYDYALHTRAVWRLLNMDSDHAKAMNGVDGTTPRLSSQGALFIAGLLHPDPSCRLTPEEALAHPFLIDSLEIPVACLTSDRHFMGKHLSSDSPLSISMKHVSLLHDQAVRKGLDSLRSIGNDVMRPSPRSKSRSGKPNKSDSSSCSSSFASTSRAKRMRMTDGLGLTMGLPMGSWSNKNEVKIDDDDDDEDEVNTDDRERDNLLRNLKNGFTLKGNVVGNMVGNMVGSAVRDRVLRVPDTLGSVVIAPPPNAIYDDEEEEVIEEVEKDDINRFDEEDSGINVRNLETVGLGNENLSNKIDKDEQENKSSDNYSDSDSDGSDTPEEGPHDEEYRIEDQNMKEDASDQDDAGHMTAPGSARKRATGGGLTGMFAMGVGGPALHRITDTNKTIKSNPSQKVRPMLSARKLVRSSLEFDGENSEDSEDDGVATDEEVQCTKYKDDYDDNHSDGEQAEVEADFIERQHQHQDRKGPHKQNFTHDAGVYLDDDEYLIVGSKRRAASRQVNYNYD